MSNANFNHPSINAYLFCKECLHLGYCKAAKQNKEDSKNALLSERKKQQVSHSFKLWDRQLHQAFADSTPADPAHTIYKKVKSMLTCLPLNYGGCYKTLSAGQYRNDVQAACEAFETEDYPLAKTLLSPHITNANSGNVPNFLLAVSCFFCGDYNNAGHFMELYKNGAGYHAVEIAEEFILICEAMMTQQVEASLKIHTMLQGVEKEHCENGRIYTICCSI